LVKSKVSTVYVDGTVTGYGLDDWGVEARVLVASRIFVTISYPMDSRGSFPGGEVASVWSWPLTCN
jgi:hypothetical protein